MSHLGMGVMLGMLGGNSKSVEAWQKAKNKTILSIILRNKDSNPGCGGRGDSVRFRLEELSEVFVLADEGQSCCESRYVSTDDDLSQFVGAKLLDIEVREAPNVPDEYGEHEVQFLVVTTDKGNITFQTHNEHNGYYGGFYIKASLETGE